MLFTLLGVLALIVAALGLYSVIAYSFSQRTRELGVRIALGAQGADVLRLVLGEGLTLVAIGVALGIVSAIGLGRFVASQLYGVTTRDPISLTLAAIILLIVGVVAGLVPAWLAARVDPVEALRAE
jgi:ABC-type antimicrobial peptide transport system permease subunit